MLGIVVYWLVTLGLGLLAAQVYLRRPPAPLWPSLFLMYAALFLWALGDAVTGTDLAFGRAYWVWVMVLYTGVIAVPPLAWLFALGFAELLGCRYRWANAFIRYTPAVVGGVFWCVMLTNPWHGEFIGLVEGARNEYRWLWHWNANVGYVFILGSILVLAHLRWHLRHSKRRSQATLILFAIVVPLILNMLFKWVFTDTRFDLTMVGLAGSCVLFFVGIYKDHLFALSPTMLRHIVEHDTDGIVLLNRDTELLMANPAAHELMGTDSLHAHEDVLSSLALQLYTPHDPPQRVERSSLLRTLRQNPQPREGHLYRFGADDTRWLRLEVTHLPGRRRSAATMNLRLRDISDFKHATETAGGQAAAIEAILGSVAEGILVVDTDGDVVYVNDRFADMWDFSRDEGTLTSAQAAFAHMMQRTCTPGAFLDVGYTHHGLDDTDVELTDGRTFALRSGPLVRDGVVKGRVWTFRDVTERRNAQLALQQSQERYQALVESAPIGILACDMAGNIQAANRALGLMLGAPDGQVRLDINLLTFPPLQEAGASALIGNCIDTGETQFAEISYASLHGKTVNMRLHVAPLHNEAGERSGVQCLVEDISERKQAEAALLHSQKLESLGVLAGGIAHDFNNLLVGVMGNAGLALSELPPDSGACEFLRGIESAADRASELTRQMLAYAGKGSFDVRPLDLNGEVADLLPLLEVSISKNVRVEFLRDAAMPAVLADPAQLQQVIMNLVTNGSDAIGQSEGTLRVSTGSMRLGTPDDTPYFRITPPGAGVYGFIRVEDSGCGIDAATLDRIFDPFFTTKFTGRGLGLAAVLGIIRGLGGALAVESEIGAGTTFTVWLPCAETPQATGSELDGGSSRTRGEGTVLVIEDDASVADVAQHALERAGYSVLVAVDGEDGLRVFDAHAREVTVVLLDLTMPRLSGKDTLQALRERDAGLPVVLSTGYSEEEATQHFTDSSYNGFVQKPYRLTDLVDAIGAALASRRHASTTP